ncbi:MAG: 50S ribosomal protein L32 [Parcubacteria group bacterium]|nr:50S ribosomal protein L32 [Parcubacteria group bacterium]
MVVRMRHTRAHTANRRSHHAVKGPRLSICAKCKSEHLKHRACAVCGTYRGKQVLDTAKKNDKKREKKTAKKAEAK